MHAHLEHKSSILRVYDDGQQFDALDPFLWSAYVYWHDRGKVAEICGVDKILTPAQWRAIRNVLEAAGAERAEFERRRGANEGRHVVLRSR